MSASSFEITAKQFASLIQPLVPLAASDYMLPLLNAIRFESQGSHVVGLATDRFRAGIHRVALAEAATDDFQFLLSLASIRRIVQIFKAPRHVDPLIRFTVEPNRVLVSQSGGLEDIDEATIAFPTLEGTFPNIRKLISDQLAEVGEPVNDLVVNATYIGDFRHAITDATPLVIRTSNTQPGNLKRRSPIVVTAGDDFVGLLMPVMAEATEQAARLSDWATFLNPKPKRTRKTAAKKQAPSKKAVA